MPSRQRLNRRGKLYLLIVLILFVTATVACDQNMDVGRVYTNATYPTPNP